MTFAGTQIRVNGATVDAVLREYVDALVAVWMVAGCDLGEIRANPNFPRRPDIARLGRAVDAKKAPLLRYFADPSKHPAYVAVAVKPAETSNGQPDWITNLRAKAMPRRDVRTLDEALAYVALAGEALRVRCGLPRDASPEQLARMIQSDLAIDSQSVDSDQLATAAMQAEFVQQVAVAHETAKYRPELHNSSCTGISLAS